MRYRIDYPMYSPLSNHPPYWMHVSGNFYFDPLPTRPVYVKTAKNLPHTRYFYLFGTREAELEISSTV